MLVQEVMQVPVTTVTPVTTVPEGVRLATARGVRYLPVAQYGELVGIVSDGDLLRAMPSAANTLEHHETAQPHPLKYLRVADIMTRSVITVPPLLPVEEAMQLMVTEKVSALPVTEGRRLRGIVTEMEVLQLLVKALGVGEPSSRVDVILNPQPGAITDVVTTVEAAGMTVSNIMTLANRAGVKEVTIRGTTVDLGPAIQALQAKGYTVRDGRRC